MTDAFLQDDVLIGEFVAESLEHLAQVENDLLSMESASGASRTEIVNNVFRAVHSIKGAAGFLALGRINELAHALEEVLGALRDGRIECSSKLTDITLRAIDKLKAMLSDVHHQSEVVVEDEVRLLGQLLFPTASDAAPANEKAAEAPIATPQRQVEGVSEDAIRDFLLESHENLDQIEKELLLLDRGTHNDQTIRSIFRSVHTMKGAAGFLGYQKLENLAHGCENLLGQLRSAKLSWNPAISTTLSITLDIFRELILTIESQKQEGKVDISEIQAHLAKLCEGATPQPTQPTKVSPPPAAAPATKPSNTTAESTSPSAPNAIDDTANKGAGTSVAESSIRVDVALLDRLMNCVGELVLARNQILQLTSNSGDRNFLNASQRLNLITSELQEGVMKTRMQPIGNAWGKFPRVVRDLAAQCDKSVELVMEGRETELDKTIIEAIKDPLTHLVRNSVDHGIERSADRVAAGKSAQGTITLRAFHEGGQVIIEVSDDGRGLNFQRIREKALERGLITQQQAQQLSDHDTAPLIFLPGFSTAEKVTHVSGRGVGMDVVKTNIERIGGHIDIQSQPGASTTMKITIPLTLAIIPALIVSAGGDRFAIPQQSLVELVHVSKSDPNRTIERIHNAPVYRLRGKLLPLISLRSLLKLPELTGWDHAGAHDLSVVVLKANDSQFGLVVDSISDTEEIVVKPLSRHLQNLTMYAGATVMGDGRVALILDVLGLARYANVMTGKPLSTESSQHDASHSQTGLLETILVAEVGVGRRVAIPISKVSRLEEFVTSQLENSDGRSVIQYRNQILPIAKLAHLIGDHSLDLNHSQSLSVVVFEHHDTLLGIAVSRVVDVLEASLEVVHASSRPGLLGSAIIQGAVTDLVDTDQLLRLAQSDAGVQA
jgi:two-component system, chemotaxis family, sensor kinase CheA